MEYVLGSLITLLVIISINLFFKRQPPQEPVQIKYSQSYIHNIIAPFIVESTEKGADMPTQASKYVNEIYLRIVFHANKAYWIKDNIFYVADVKNREIQHETATQVDTMSMDKVQLNDLMMIVERLTEGT